MNSQRTDLSLPVTQMAPKNSRKPKSHDDNDLSQKHNSKHIQTSTDGTNLCNSLTIDRANSEIQDALFIPPNGIEQPSLEELLAPLAQEIREIAQSVQGDKARKIAAVKTTRKTAKAKAKTKPKSALVEQDETSNEQQSESKVTLPGSKITFRVSSSELRELAERCFNQGTDQSEYIRCCVFGYPMPRPRPVMPQVNRDLYIELGRLGNNLNQLVKTVHTAILKGQQPVTSRVGELINIILATKHEVDDVRIMLSGLMPKTNLNDD